MNKSTVTAAANDSAQDMFEGRVITHAILHQPDIIWDDGYKPDPVTNVALITNNREEAKSIIAIYELGLEIAKRYPNLLGDKLRVMNAVFSGSDLTRLADYVNEDAAHIIAKSNVHIVGK